MFPSGPLYKRLFHFADDASIPSACEEYNICSTQLLFRQSFTPHFPAYQLTTHRHSGFPIMPTLGIICPSSTFPSAKRRNIASPPAVLQLTYNCGLTVRDSAREILRLGLLFVGVSLVLGVWHMKSGNGIEVLKILPADDEGK